MLRVQSAAFLGCSTQSTHHHLPSLQPPLLLSISLSNCQRFVEDGRMTLIASSLEESLKSDTLLHGSGKCFQRAIIPFQILASATSVSTGLIKFLYSEYGIWNVDKLPVMSQRIGHVELTPLPHPELYLQITIKL